LTVKLLLNQIKVPGLIAAPLKFEVFDVVTEQGAGPETPKVPDTPKFSLRLRLNVPVGAPTDMISPDVPDAAKLRLPAVRSKLGKFG
jgi:hypothetical protein